MMQKKSLLKPQCMPDGTYRLIAAAKGGNLVALMDECYDLHEAGRYQEACMIRSKAFPMILDAIDEAMADCGGQITLDRNHANTVTAMEFIHTAAIDNYLMNLCEVAAAQHELLIDCDEEDPLQATPTLALCYVAIGDWENLEAIEMDMDTKSPLYALTHCCRLYAELGIIEEEALAVLRRYHKPLCNELLLDEHPTDEAYMRGIMVEPPEPKAMARELYLRCEVALSHQIAFVEALRERLQN